MVPQKGPSSRECARHPAALLWALLLGVTLARRTASHVLLSPSVSTIGDPCSAIAKDGLVCSLIRPQLLWLLRGVE